MKKKMKNSVEDFIDNFYILQSEAIIGNLGVSHKRAGDVREGIRYHYRCGYCYYFATILKAAFGRGTICWAAPLGHIVWKDTDGKAYDVEGRFIEAEHDCYYLIPEGYLGDHINDFKHVDAFKPRTHASKEILIGIVKNYCNDTGEKYYSDIEHYFRE